MDESKKKKTAKVEAAEPTETETDAVAAAQKVLADTLAELDACRKELATTQAELSEAKDKYLRMLAEYDNYRKRTQKEQEGAYANGLADAVSEILPVIDNLGRAAAVEDATKIADGLALTLKQASACLSALKVEETAKVGDTFDPNVHNAVMHIEDESYGEGEIVEVFQRGYRRGDKVIRDAMVKVAN